MSDDIKFAIILATTIAVVLCSLIYAIGSYEIQDRQLESKETIAAFEAGYTQVGGRDNPVWLKSETLNND